MYLPSLFVHIFMSGFRKKNEPFIPSLLFSQGRMVSLMHRWEFLFFERCPKKKKEAAWYLKKGSSAVSQCPLGDVTPDYQGYLVNLSNFMLKRCRQCFILNDEWAAQGSCGIRRSLCFSWGARGSHFSALRGVRFAGSHRLRLSG